MMLITGREMVHEKNKEVDGMNKEFQRQIQILVESHKEEVDVSVWCLAQYIDLAKPKSEAPYKYFTGNQKALRLVRAKAVV